MRKNPTQSLSLRHCADGYWRTSWCDDHAKLRQRSFGRDKKRAHNRFAAFFAMWKTDRLVRNPSEEGSAPTLAEAFERFNAHAVAHYRRADGTKTGEAATIAQAMKFLLDLFGKAKVDAIDASHLKEARKVMVRRKLSVNTINAYVRKVRQVWRWFANENLVSPTAWHGMVAVQALEAGRGVDLDGDVVQPETTEAVEPVPEADVLAVCDKLPLTIRSMVMTQYLTGARPTEVCLMRGMDIDRSGPIWLYRPQRHKTQHRRKKRVIAIGPKAQEWLTPMLVRAGSPVAYLFQPKAAWTERHEAKRAAYQAGKGKGDYRKWKRVREREAKPRGGEIFERTSYARAVARACKAEPVTTHWHPNQLRHNAATRIREEFGIEVAGAVLGHSKTDMTEVYAKVGVDKAVTAMERSG